MSTMKECCLNSFLNGEPRLYEAYYLCKFEIAQENVSKIYNVLAKRRGEIINETPHEELLKSYIEAILPVAESFGFVEEIRRKTSGLTNPMLQFYKWKILDVDPFDIQNKEDIIDFGVREESSNIAKTYVNQIRERKGMKTDQKLVQKADKQRNLAKNM